MIEDVHDVIDFLRTKYVKVLKVFSDNQLRPVENEFFQDGDPEVDL